MKNDTPQDNLPLQNSGFIEAAPGVMISRRDITIRCVRSSGPGGQNVNKRSTKVRLSIDISAISDCIGVRATSRLKKIAGDASITEQGWLLIVCDENRTQIANRRTCFERLRQMIIQARIRPRIRKKTNPTKASIQRRLDDKKHRSSIKTKRKPLRNDD